MPIVGFTDKTTISRQALPVPVFASVKKGAEKPERGVGKNLSHFRFDWEDLRAKEIFESLYGEDKQHELLITVLGNEVEGVLDSSYRLYGANEVMKRKCDGCQILKALDAERGSPCVCDPAKRDSDNYKDREGQCSPKGFFYFTLPDLCKALGYLGQFVLTTGSLYEMRDIATVLHTVKQTSGRLAAQPFLLRRTEKSYSVNGKNMTQWNVEIVPPIHLVISGLDTPILGAPNTVAALPAGEILGEPDTYACQHCGTTATKGQAESLGMECPDCGGSFFYMGEGANEKFSGAPVPPALPEEAGQPGLDDVDDWLNTPPTLTPEQLYMKELIKIVSPMCKHENHAINAIQAAIRENELTPDMSLDKAAVVVFKRRCVSQWGWTSDEIPGKVEKALGRGLRAYLADNERDWDGVWKALIAKFADEPF